MSTATFQSRHYATLSVLTSLSLNQLAPKYSIQNSVLKTASVLFFFICTLRVVYWLVLYPAYFTPFRSLPTPPKRYLLTGNEEVLFKDPSGAVARKWAETVPNNGFLRYYTALNLERILVTSPAAIGEILVQKGYDFAKPDQIKVALGRITGEGLGSVEGDTHKMQRKQLQPAFSHRHIKDLYPAFWKKGVEMTKEIERQHCLANQIDSIITAKDWASRVTLDIIGVAGMDHDFGALKHPDNKLVVQYRKMFREPNLIMKSITVLGYFFDLRLLHKLPVQVNLEMNQGRDFIRSVARKVVRQKQEKLAQKQPLGKDLISVALSSNVFTDENLVDHMMTFLAAGHESTSGSLSWTMYAMCKYPDIQSRLRVEIRSMLPSISDENASPPDAAAVDALPYLSAVCNEVIRCFPTVAITYRQALKDNTVSGMLVPKGTMMILSAEATNHDTKLWGPDAAEFNPERWLVSGQANNGGAKSNYASMSFIHGPRSCIGSGFSKAELSCLVAALVGRFEMEFEDPSYKVELSAGMLTAPKGGLPVRVKAIGGW